MTLKDFIEQSGMNASLVRAVVRQCGGWAAFQEMAQDVTNHGADSGFSGFIYYTETCDFYAKNQEAIKALAQSMADDFGQSAMELVKGFNCLHGDSGEEEVGQTLYGTKRQHDNLVANALAWFALEEVSRRYEDLK